MGHYHLRSRKVKKVSEAVNPPKRKDPDPVDRTSGCGFLDLPAELRNEIYYYYFTSSRGGSSGIATFRLPAITAVSKQIRSEVLPTMFAEHEFAFYVDVPPPAPEPIDRGWARDAYYHREQSGSYDGRLVLNDRARRFLRTCFPEGPAKLRHVVFHMREVPDTSVRLARVEIFGDYYVRRKERAAMLKAPYIPPTPIQLPQTRRPFKHRPRSKLGEKRLRPDEIFKVGVSYVNHDSPVELTKVESIRKSRQRENIFRKAEEVRGWAQAVIATRPATTGTFSTRKSSGFTIDEIHRVAEVFHFSVHEKESTWELERNPDVNLGGWHLE